MKLLHDLVLINEIKKATDETKSASGLIIPTGIAEPEYEVIQIGTKCVALKVGDKIRLYEHAKKTPFNDGYLINEAIGIKAVL